VTERHPLDRTGIEPEIALQLLVGYAAGHLAACHDAAKAIRLQSNASVTTRGKLEHLLQAIGYAIERQRILMEQVEARCKSPWNRHCYACDG
jgi:hypothetical protein